MLRQFTHKVQGKQHLPCIKHGCLVNRWKSQTYRGFQLGDSEIHRTKWTVVQQVGWLLVVYACSSAHSSGKKGFDNFIVIPGVPCWIEWCARRGGRFVGVFVRFLVICCLFMSNVNYFEAVHLMFSIPWPRFATQHLNCLVFSGQPTLFWH